MKHPIKLSIVTGAMALAALATPAGAGVNFQATARQGVNFQGVNSHGVNFQGVNVQRVNVQGVNFQGVNFQGVNFQGTTVGGFQLAGSALVVRVYLGASATHHIYADVTDGSATYEYVPIAPGRPTVTGAFAATLTGMTFQVGTGRTTYKVRIDQSASDPSVNSMTAATGNQSNADVRLYTLSIQNPANQAWIPVCGGGPGVFVSGTWNAAGAYDATVGLTYACSVIGVIAKCIQQWGY
jgi:hypothetical protein